jgi:hypothetical protein
MGMVKAGTIPMLMMVVPVIAVPVTLRVVVTVPVLM